MLGVDLPGAHAGQHRVDAGDAAVAVVRRVQVIKPVGAQRDAGGGEGRMADHQQHFLRIGAQRVRLCVELAPQRHSLIEHALWRCTPLVDRPLRALGVPDAALAQGGHVVVGQFLPGTCLMEVEGRIEQSSLHLDEAWHAGHHLAGAAVVEERAECDQRVAEGVVARERLHRRPRAAVGGAQHQHAGPVALHHAFPGVGLFELHGARHEPAHRVRQQPHRLLAGVAGSKQGLDLGRQALRFVFDGAAPVEGERGHLVAVGQTLDQVVVAAADGAVGCDARGGGRVPRELHQSVDEAKTEPDALAVECEVGAQDAWKHDYRRAIRRVGARPAARTSHRFGSTRSACILAGPRQRADGRKVFGRGVDQRAGDGCHGAVVGKVVEVRDLAAAVEQETRTGSRCAGGTWRAAVHRTRLHDEVVVGPVEGVGQQRLHPCADRVALQVACHHAQVAWDRLGVAVQPFDHRAVRHHGLDAGQLGRVSPAPRNLMQKLDELRRHRHPRQCQPPLQH